MAVVRYKNREYLLKEWEGDEYLRPEGIREIYTLGRRLKKNGINNFDGGYKGSIRIFLIKGEVMVI